MGLGEELLKDTNPQGLFHGLMMTVAWVGCQQVAIWSIYFRNRFREAIYVHGAAMIVLILLATIGTVQIIIFKGTQVITKTYTHTLLGFVVTCLIPLVLALGFISRLKQNSHKTHPNQLDKLKIAHIIGGWVLIAASRIPLYNQWIIKTPVVFLVLIIFDFFLNSFYFYKKITQPRMESVSVQETKIQPRNLMWLKQIKSSKDLEIFHGDYFIFADFVYRLSPILTSHPGGFRIINKVRGREVDRFLYGVQTLEKFEDVPRVSHTARSIELAGAPVARLQRTKIYPRMEELNSARISAINFYQCSKRIYTVYLRPKDTRGKNFEYTGYTDLSQLGKYYAVTIADRKTRLYTMVNFLQKKTVKLVEQVTKGGVFSKKEKESLAKQHYGEQNHFSSICNWESGQVDEEETTSDNSLINYSQFDQKLDVQEEMRSNSSGRKHKESYIPLLIKKYDMGQFTSVFLREGFKGDIKISSPRGRGLGLQDIACCSKPCKIIMFSGGTGIYPFADIIDLAFKELLMQNQLLDEKESKFRSRIMKGDPILETKPFQHFEFTLYISVPTVEQIHPITLFQCEFLSLHSKMKVFLKSARGEDRVILNERYPHIQISDHRYEKVLWQINQEQISRIYICGPTRMTKAMILELERLEWSPHKYFVL